MRQAARSLTLRGAWVWLLPGLILPAEGAAPPAAGVVFPAGSGVVDVTKPPYNARGDGRTDDTEALRSAIADHVGKRNVIYLPDGVYLVSDTLRWPDHDRKGEHVWGFTHVQGQSRERTVIRLRDGRFRDPSKPSPVMTAGPHGSADWFACFVCDLTIDTGRDNAGAVGLQFFSNNTGAVRSVAVVSGDGEGRVGLDLAYNDMNGPLLVKDLKVRGFEVGVWAGHSVNSQTFEHVELTGQGECAFRNDGQAVSVRGLTTRGSVPAVLNQGGLMVLTEATLRYEGPPGPGRASAVVNRAALYARNLRTAGFDRAVEDGLGPGQDRPGPRHAAGPDVAEYLSHPALSLFPDGRRPDPLPVRETPEVPHDDPSTWANVVKFGADPTAGRDSADAIQAAVDSGASTVFFPTGGYNLSRPVLLRKNVRRVMGQNSVVDYFSKSPVAFRLVDGSAPVVVVQNFFPLGAGLKHESARTLVVRDSELRRYEGTGRGDLFVEDCVAGPWTFDRQNVWARQLNAENKGTHVTNRGGRLWVLGFKTERGGTLVETTDGGRTRVDGGFSYTTEAGKLAPMFVTRDSDLSASFAEVCYNGDPFTTLARETRAGRVAELARTDPRWRGAFVLFEGAGRP